LENERSGIVVGETEIARARQKRSEKERKTVGRSASGSRGERERGSHTGKEGREVRKGKEKTGRRTKEAPSTDEGQQWELKGETGDDAEVRRFSL